MQTRPEKIRRGLEQNEIADLQNKLAHKAKIAKKEIERAKVSSSGGSIFRSISPVGTPDDNLTKVSGRMDKTEEAENVTSSIKVPPGYQQTSDSATVITVQSTHGGQCTALARDLKPSVKPTISTEAAIRDIGMDRTKIVIGAGSTLSLNHTAGQNWLAPTNGGNLSSAQLANTKKQYLPSQGPKIASNTRDDYFIRSSFSKTEARRIFT